MMISCQKEARRSKEESASQQLNRSGNVNDDNDDDDGASDNNELLVVMMMSNDVMMTPALKSFIVTMFAVITRADTFPLTLCLAVGCQAGQCVLEF